MTFTRGIPALLLLFLGLTACGSSSSTTKPGIQPNKIVVSELSEPIHGLSAYEVVQQYKSHWLRKRGRTSINNPVPIKVYLDGTSSPFGNVSSLRKIQAVNIVSITRFTPNEAQFKFGLGNVAGAILVKTKPAGN